MIQPTEIRALLNAAIDREGLVGERERVARWTAGMLVEIVRKIVVDEVRKAKRGARKDS